MTPTPMPPNMSATMSPKASMLVAGLGAWMYAATACAALPFLYAIPQLKGAGSMAPLIAALSLGAVVCIPLSISARRMSGLPAPEKNMWAMLTAGEAVFFGVICWGMPLGLMFATDEFLQSADAFAVVPEAITWLLTGVAFGLVARWQAQRRARRAPA